jgi:hypothetical protein
VLDSHWRQDCVGLAKAYVKSLRPSISYTHVPVIGGGGIAGDNSQHAEHKFIAAATLLGSAPAWINASLTWPHVARVPLLIERMMAPQGNARY